MNFSRWMPASFRVLRDYSLASFAHDLGAGVQRETFMRPSNWGVEVILARRLQIDWRTDQEVG